MVDVYFGEKKVGGARRYEAGYASVPDPHGRFLVMPAADPCAVQS